MAATPPATLIDVIVLIFARSELKNLVGTDALRTVLTGDRDLFPSPGTMSLQPVWDLIESQPGFDAAQAVPPMCRIKTWENQLKVKVELPAALADLDLATRDKKAMECNIGDDDLNKILKPVVAPVKKETTRALESSSGPAPETRSNLKMRIAIGAAVLGVIAAGVSIYLTVGRDDSNTVKVSSSELSSDVPLTDVRRNGKFMVATITDAKAWLAKPEFERRKQLEAIGPKVRMQQASGLMVMDAQGLVIAMLKLDRNPQVTFPK